MMMLKPLWSSFVFPSKVTKSVTFFSKMISIRRYSLSSFSFTNPKINPFGIHSVRRYCLAAPPQSTTTAKDCILFYQIDKGDHSLRLNLLEPLESNVNDDDILVHHRIRSHLLPGDLSGDWYPNVIASSMGLLCFTGEDHTDPIHVCNPVTGEYVRVSPNKDDYADADNHDTTFGFVFDCHTQQYKILRMMLMIDGNNYAVVTQICTLGASPEWRNLESPPQIPPGVETPQVFVHESLHWLVAHDRLIMSFHVGREDFNLIYLPFEIARAEKKLIFLKELGGYLGLIDFSSIDHAEIWIMKEYGVEDSWTKQFVIPRPPNRHVRGPIKWMNSGNFLFLFFDLINSDDELVCYDPVTKTLPKKWGLPRNVYRVIRHTWSSVSLMDIVGKPGSSRNRG